MFFVLDRFFVEEGGRKRVFEFSGLVMKVRVFCVFRFGVRRRWGWCDVMD